MGFWDKLSQAFASERGAHDPDLDKFQDLIGYRFRDQLLLVHSLTHRSFVGSGNNHLPSNERLEFLGDSVLGLIVAHQLYRDYTEMREGDLTKTKAMLVNETTLAQVGREIGLNQYIKLSPEEEKTGGRDRASIISDAFESVIGAVYIDGGLKVAHDMVMRFIYSRKESILSDISQRNFKGELLELVQSTGSGMPRYDVVAERGPDHEKVFHVVVSVGGKKVGEGRGLSKKEAEQGAAREGLEEFQKRGM